MEVKSVLGILIGGCAIVAGAGFAATLLPSCAQTPTNVPVQTFEQPKNMDVVCMRVLDDTGTYSIIPAVPQPQSSCAQVPVNVTGSSLPFHLFALVTQTTRGELAVVDLTGGNVVDVDPGIPGINFLPVGRLPTDVAVTPDGRVAFVGSADPNAPAIYALPTTIILGDAQSSLGTPPPAADAGQTVIPDLTTWPVCALPQAPGAVRVLPNSVLPATAGGGAPVSSAAGYVIVAVLPGDATHAAEVATIDPAPLLRGGIAYVGDAGVGSGTVDPPGALVACTYLQHIPLASPSRATTWTAGPAWDDGVKYVDGGVDADVPQTAVACAQATDAGSPGLGGAAPLFPTAVAAPSGGAAALDLQGPRPILYVADAALPLIHVIDLSDPSSPQELSPLLATSIASPTRAVTVGQIAVSPTTREYKRFLYAIDRTMGGIMVYEVTNPETMTRVPLTRPHPELDPFQPPDRLIFNAPVASVAFVQHDWPLQEKYATNDLSGSETALLTAETGLQCNPNPFVDANPGGGGLAIEQGPFLPGPLGDGAYYRFSESFQQLGLTAQRLRGVFAFATLSSGNMITIDVDDWDAPCRRPDPLAARGTLSGTADLLVDGPFSAIAPPEPPGSATELGPYNAPVTFETGYTDSPVTLEWFYPVSAPHRARSGFYLKSDPVDGLHAPYLLGVPQLFSSGAPIATQGTQATANPLLVPTETLFVDPSIQSSSQPDPSLRTSTITPAPSPLVTSPDGGTTSSLTLVQSDPAVAVPSVRFAWEDPTVQTDQDWAVTYEGTLPGFFDNASNPLVLTDVATTDNYSSLTLSDSSAYFCSKGIEDFSLGQQRAQSELTAMSNAGLVPKANLPVADAGGDGEAIENFTSQVSDYIQLTDSIRSTQDPYWLVDNACWSGISPDPNDTSYLQSNPNAPASRVNLCNATYGQILDPTSPSLQRDFPIIHARDGSLVIGRFGYTSGTPGPRLPGGKWAVVGPDPSNAPFLRLMQCCFHDQVSFNLRTGGQWSAVGSANGFLHHIEATGADGTCAPSCEARDALLNGRAAPVPRPAAVTGAEIPCNPTFVPSITRDSPLAFRNPQFSFFIWNGQNANTACSDIPPVRDMQWTFSTRGQFSPQTLNLAATTSGLSPQSMFFIDSLGQLAIIDGSSQGLILIDLDTITEAHTPYF